MKNKNIRYIDITLHNIEDASSKYNDNSLNEELDKYISKESLALEKKENIVFRVYTKFEITKTQKEHVVRMIRSNYGIDISDNLELIKHENIKRLILLIIGVLSVVISELLEPIRLFITSDIFLIIGWGAIWEAVYSFMFVNTKRRYDTKRLKKIVESKIEFLGDDDE